MSGQTGDPLDGLADLRMLLRAFPGVEVDEESGAANDDGWWHLSMQVDRDMPGAWHSIAVLAKLFNTDAHDGGSAIFKPIAKLDIGGTGEDLVLWSLSHLYGSFGAADAAGAILRHFEDRREPGNVEE